MIRIKEIVRNVEDVFKNLFSKFTITTIVIFLATIVYAILVDSVVFDDIVPKYIQFSVIFGVGSFFLESITKSLNKKRIIGEFVLFIFSIILTYLLNITNDLFSIDKDMFVNYVLRFTVAYCICLATFAIYANFKKSNISFEEYVTKVCLNVIKSSIIFIVLSIGLAIIVLVFSYLILNTDEYLLNLRIEVLLLGLYYIPKLVYSFYNVKGEINNFFKFVVKTILPSLLIIAFIVIYLYIAKIILTLDVPSNQIFRIIAGLFIFGLPIWTMATYFKEDNKLYKICKNLPYLFIPFIFLQVYSIAVRIVNNGFTEARYLCVMLIIFEIIYIALYFKNKEKIANILIVFVGISTISLIVPFINMYKISFYSQFNNLKIYKEKEDLTESDKQKIQGAYYYLIYDANSEEIVNNYLNSDEIYNIINFEYDKYNEYDKEDNIKHMSVKVNDEMLNIQGYNKIYNNINSDDFFSGAKDIDAVFKNLKFTTKSGEYEFSIDLRNMVKTYIEHEDDINEYFKNNNRVIIDENRCLVITYFSINYTNKNLITYFSIDGYLLEK